MIHGSSTDPVIIKKIYLKVWTLRSEVEAVIQKRVANGEKAEDISLKEIMDEYKYEDVAKTEAKLTALEGGQSEEAETPEGEEPAAETPEGEEASAEDNESEENSEEIKIIQRGSHNIPEDESFGGMMVLSELGMGHIYFFCEKQFLSGQSIVLEFLVPEKFVINCEVAYCRPYNLKSRIISEKKLPFRVAAAFTFLKEGERTLLRKFIASVEPEVVIEVPKIKKDSGGGGGGDDFDELDDLDL